MKILMVGPGLIPIPSTGWGAIETVIWQQKIHLEQLGCHVDILNERGLRAVLKIKPWNYTIVHLHYDGLSAFWIDLARIFKFSLLITTHDGYAAFADKWGNCYKETVRNLSKSDGLIVLSPEIHKTFRDYGFRGWLEVLPNGTEVDKIKFESDGNGKAICLGRIEPRKRQATIASILNSECLSKCDFVGPIGVDELVVDNLSTQYLGTWNREDVHARLTKYSCLVLASDGEAHPLVVVEAMAAGLSIVVTPEAAANLQPDLPFVHIVKKIDEIDEIIDRACRENHNYRNEIRQYAQENFSWQIISKNYLKLVGEYLQLKSGKVEATESLYFCIQGVNSIIAGIAKQLFYTLIEKLRIRSIKKRILLVRDYRWNT